MKYLFIVAILFAFSGFIISLGFAIQDNNFMIDCKAAGGIVVGEPSEYKCATGIEFLDLSKK